MKIVYYYCYCYYYTINNNIRIIRIIFSLLFLFCCGCCATDDENDHFKEMWVLLVGVIRCLSENVCFTVFWKCTAVCLKHDLANLDL